MAGDLERLNAELLRSIDSLIADLHLPPPQGGRRGSRAVRLGPRGSLQINLSGVRAGRFRDHYPDGSAIGSGPSHGDLIDLVSYAKGLTTREAIAWARAWLGEPEELRASRRPEPTPAPAPGRDRSRRAEGEEERRARQLAAAQDMWASRRPVFENMAERYLAGRGLRVPPGCSALGYVPRAWHRTVECELTYWPALVAAICDAAGELVGIQRTYLQPLPGGAVRKAPLPNPRLTLGGYWHGAIRLTGEPGLELALTEGVETGLAVWMGTGLKVWAVNATNNFPAVHVPEHVRTVILCGDGDEPDLARTIALGRTPRTGTGRHLAHAIGVHRRAGRRVVLAVPPGSGGTDWADVMSRAGAGR